MPRESDNLKLTLYDSVADIALLAKEWFINNFGYTNSNLTKIDAAYKELKDGLVDAPTKTGEGATGTWNINISGNASTATTATTATDATNASSAVHDGAGNDINSTYIKSIAINDTSLTLTKGNDITETVAFKTDKNLVTDGMPADGKAVGEAVSRLLMMISYGKEDLISGTSPLPTGHVYFVYADYSTQPASDTTENGAQTTSENTINQDTANEQEASNSVKKL